MIKLLVVFFELIYQCFILQKEHLIAYEIFLAKTIEYTIGTEYATSNSEESNEARWSYKPYSHLNKKLANVRFSHEIRWYF